VTTEGLPRALRWLGWLGAAAGLAVVLAVMLTVTTASPLTRAAKPVRAACGKAAGPFSVRGTHVVGRGGQVFVSYGITVPGLQAVNWRASASLDRKQIMATADDWCANTVRLQLDQDNLVGPHGTSFDRAYLTAIESEVSLAEGLRLVVVLNDETNFAATWVRNYQQGPTPGTETFWKDLAKVYGHDPQVIFDLFNEPRLYSPGMSEAQEWQLWLRGGRFEGVFYPFGMAALAAYVRNTVGARNLLWVEGPRYSRTFSGMVRYRAVLHVSGVVYAVHHPMGWQDPADWDSDFGYLIADGIAPVVDGEWANHEPPLKAHLKSVPGYCWLQAPVTVPEYLSYLSAHGVGLNAYDLEPGLLIKSYRNLADPTTINARTWSCLYYQEEQPGQGAGSEILAWFKQHNS
jgi:Cellulase (glycosyl hydrolase family 5)